MKKFLLFAMAAFAMIAASCTKEPISMASVGDEVPVTITADLGAIESRAIADGLKVNEVAWAIYLHGADTPLSDLQGTLPISNKEGKLEVRLVTGKSYDLAFFAYYTENPVTKQTNGGVPAPVYYQVNWNEKTVAVQYPSGPLANEDDARDCFWYVEQDLKVESAINETFVLTRPLAQLNFGATVEDTQAAADAGLVVGSSKIVASTYTQFNMFTGACLDPEVVEYTFAQNAVPAQALTVKNVDYTYLGTVYLLVNEEMTQDVALTIFNAADGKEINTVEYSYAPFKRNWRTNILGSLLTNPVDFTIIVDERFEEPDYIVKHWDGTTKAITPDANGVYNVTEPAELAWVAEQVNSGENNFDGAAIVIPEDNVVIDMNSANGQLWTPIGNSANPFRGSFNGNGVIIRNVAIKTSECAGLFGSVISSEGITNIALENVTIEANHYAGAVAGYAYSDITYCSVEGLEIVVTPNEVATRATTYDNGDKVGGIVGYVGEDGYTISYNSIDGAQITGYRDIGGIAGAAYIKECKSNKVYGTTITVDQETNFYGRKKINTGKVVGRLLGGTIGTNTTSSNIKFIYKPADLEYLSVEDVLDYKSGAAIKIKGWVVATCTKGFVISDESQALLYVFNPKTYPKVGDVVTVSGSASTYGNSKLVQVNSGSVVTVLAEEEPKNVIYPEVANPMTAEEVDAYFEQNTRIYTKIRGKLIVSGDYVNIDIPGAKVQGSVMYPDDDLMALAKTLEGAIVYVEGYAMYTYNGYMNICTTEIYDAKEETNWGIVGEMTEWGNTGIDDIRMYTYNDGFAFARGVEIKNNTAPENQGFKIRAYNDKTWNNETNYGTNDVKIYSNMPVPVYTGGGSGNIIPVEPGTYDIYFDIVNFDKVYVMEAGKSIDEAIEYDKFEEPKPELYEHTWRLVGSFNGWNPNDDNYKLTLTENKKWATTLIRLAEDAELKFTADGKWDYNFGSSVTVELGKEYTTTQGGANIKVPAGNYEVKFSMCDHRFVFKKAILTSTLSFADKANRNEQTTTQQVWSQNGVTFINEKAASTNNVANYANPVRLYQNSKVTIEVDGLIQQIVFDCNSSSYASSLNKSITSGDTVTVDGDKVTVVLATPASSFVVPKLSAQVRLDSLDVTYEW